MKELMSNTIAVKDAKVIRGEFIHGKQAIEEDVYVTVNKHDIAIQIGKWSDDGKAFANETTIILNSAVAAKVLGFIMLPPLTPVPYGVCTPEVQLMFSKFLNTQRVELIRASVIAKLKEEGFPEEDKGIWERRVSDGILDWIREKTYVRPSYETMPITWRDGMLICDGIPVSESSTLYAGAFDEQTIADAYTWAEGKAQEESGLNLATAQEQVRIGQLVIEYLKEQFIKRNKRP